MRVHLSHRWLSFSVVLLLCLFIPVTQVAQEKITLRVSTWATSEELAMDEMIIDEFERAHPEFDVQYEPIPHYYEEKILTTAAAGSAPDVFLLDSKIIPSFLNKGVLVDLMPYVQRLNVDLGEYFPNVLAIAMRDSQLYAFPKDFTPLVVYYNKTIFDREGLPYPQVGWTWEEYLDIAKRLTRDTDGDGRVDQFGTSFVNYFLYWIVWVWMNGGDVFSPDGRRATGYFNSPATEEALQFFINLQHKHKVAPWTGSYQEVKRTGIITALFTSGKIAMILDGHWRIPFLRPYIKEGVVEIGTVPLPVPPGRRSVNVMYEAGWCVPVTSKYPAEAVKLAAFLSGEYASRVRSKLGLGVSALRNVAAEQVENDDLGLEQAFFEEIPHARQPWGTILERSEELEFIFQDAVDEVVLGGKEIHDVFTRHAQRLDERLNEIHSMKELKFEPIRGNVEIVEFLFIVGGGVLGLGLLGLVLVRRKERRELEKGYFFLFPSMVHLLVFLFTPVVFAFYLSFHRWDIVVPQKPFVGVENFREMLFDPLFWNALKNTLVFALNVPVGMTASLGVALLMNQRIRGVNLLRTLYFLPSVSSFVAIALVWRWLYNPQFGIANYALELVGLEPIGWLNSPDTAMFSVIAMTVWLGLGYQMVIFLAGLQGIPSELYEASVLDGASAWSRFRHITLPLLQPTTFFVLITSLIGAFQVFTSIYIMTGGGPARSTDVIVYHIYQAAWVSLRMGYAAAMSLVLFVIIMVATYIQFKLVGRNVEYSYT